MQVINMKDPYIVYFFDEFSSLISSFYVRSILNLIISEITIEYFIYEKMRIFKTANFYQNQIRTEFRFCSIKIMMVFIRMRKLNQK